MGTGKAHIPKVNFNKQIRSISDLHNITKNLEIAFAEYLSELARDKMQDKINEKIYLDNKLTGGKEPTVYERTGELLDAVTCTQLSNGTWSIGIDGRKIKSTPREYTSELGQHAGVDGQSVSGRMSEFIENGVDNGIYPMPALHIIKEVQDEINKIYQSEWEKFAMINGFKSTRR